jgi:hypothetical protein
MPDANDSTDHVVELLQTQLGASLVEDEHEALREGPGPVRLSEAFSEIRAMNAHFTSSRPGQLATAGARGVSEGSGQVLRYWRSWIAAWYWNSPTAILECEQCAELRFTGKKERKKCKRCPGTLAPIEPPFEGRRPRPKKVKL